MKRADARNLYKAPIRRIGIFPSAVERLEDRIAPAGAVVATLTKGALTITGDDADNEIEIRIDAANVVITGANGTLIGGQASITLPGTVQSLTATMKGGNNVITTPAGVDFKVPKSAMFDMGTGDNDLEVTAPQIIFGALTFKGGDGKDTVNLDGGTGMGSKITGAASFLYGVGDSDTSLADLQALGAIKISAANGADAITLDTVIGKTVTATLGAGSPSLGTSNFSADTSTLTGVQITQAEGPLNVALNTGAVNGSVKVKSGEGIVLDMSGMAITGSLGVTGGNMGSSLVDVDLTGVSTVGGMALSGAIVDVNLAAGASMTVAKDTGLKGRFTMVTVLGTLVTKNLSFTGNSMFGSAVLSQEDPAASTVVNGNLQVKADSAIVEIGTNAVAGGTLHVVGKTAVNGGTLGQLINRTGATNSLLDGDVTVSATSRVGDAVVDITGGFVTFGKSLAVKSAGATDVTFDTNLLTEVKGKVGVTGGNLADNFEVTTLSKFGKDVLLNFKNGPATVSIGGSGVAPVDVLGAFTITSGAGSDRLNVNGLSVRGATKINTGAGADILDIRNGTYSKTVSVNLGDGDDDLLISSVASAATPVVFQAKTIVLAGNGNDSLTLGRAMGSGGNAKTIATFAAGAAGSKIDGGTGLNAFDDESGAFTGIALVTGIISWTDLVP